MVTSFLLLTCGLKLMSNMSTIQQKMFRKLQLYVCFDFGLEVYLLGYLGARCNVHHLMNEIGMLGVIMQSSKVLTRG